jgi:hypothetical protein
LIVIVPLLAQPPVAVAELWTLGIVARMAIIPFVIVTWLIHASIAAVLSAPVVLFSRKRIHWRRYELLVFVIPFAIWFSLCGFTGIRSKTLSNAAIEPAMFSLAVPIAALVRVVIGARISERACVAGLIAAVSVVAVGVYFLVPGLPE